MLTLVLLNLLDLQGLERHVHAGVHSPIPAWRCPIQTLLPGIGVALERQHILSFITGF